MPAPQARQPVGSKLSRSDVRLLVAGALFTAGSAATR